MKLIQILFLIISTFIFAADAISSDSVPERRTGWLYSSPGSVASDYTSFSRDKDGFLWIGTDSGLLRFDGNNYDIYTPDPTSENSISDNRILDLLSDSSGRLWVATANGLNLYDHYTDSFRLIKLPSLDFNGYIISMAEQADGTVSFIVSGVGIFVIGDEDGEPKAIRYMHNMPEEKNYNYLCASPDGRMYAGSHKGVLSVISKNGSVKTVQISSGYINSMAVERDGNILVSDVCQVYRYNVNSNEVSCLDSDSRINIKSLSPGSDGVVYAATWGRGIWRVSPGSSRVEQCDDIYSPFLNIGDLSVGAVYSSKEGNLWLGCNYFGIVMVPARKQPFFYRRISDSFPNYKGGINAMSVWNGNVVVSIDKGRIVMFSPGGKVLMQTKMPDMHTASFLLPDGDGKMLVGVADDGIWELSLPSGNLRKLIDIPGNYPKIVIEHGRAGELFIAAHGIGVMRYDRNTGHTTWLECDSQGEKLLNYYINTFHRTPDNKIWIGLYSGLSCYDLEADSLIKVDQLPFMSGVSSAITTGENGSVYVATSQGLIHYHPTKGFLRKYSHHDGLMENEIRSMSEDANGVKWFGSMRGISYKKADTDTIISFRGGRGMMETTFGHMVYSPDNNIMYLGSNLGITTFTPGGELYDFDIPGIRVSAIYLNGNKLTGASKIGDKNVIEGNPVMPEVLSLPYSNNSMMFQLSTKDFRDGSNISYRWRLLGQSKEWSSTRPGESVIYLPYLDPGEYTLEMQGVENDTMSEPISIKVRISSPWYLSTTAKILYLMIAVVFVVLILMILKHKREEQENDAKIRFFMDVSHDIRSPITLILSPLESLMTKPFDDDVKGKLHTMHRNANRILSLVNQLLDIRKLEKGKMHLSCRLTDVDNFVKELVEMFKPQAAEKNIDMTYMEHGDVPQMWIDRDKLDKVLVNLISNAIKYTPSGGSISVDVNMVVDEVIGESIEISVTDTGIGLDTKTAARIFERFYQGREEGKSSHGGFGIGLDLCRRLVELHHGVISGKNREDGCKGSVFSVRLPIDETCYGDDDFIIEDDEESADIKDKDWSFISRHILPMSDKVPDNQQKPKNISIMRNIMVVDDDQELRDYLCRYLGDRYLVTGVADGELALQEIIDNPPELIISDVAMPGMDGLTLLRRLKSNSETHHIPVILLSTKNDVADRMAGWDRGADGYLGKPFNLEELEMMIDNLIDNRLRMKGKFSGIQDKVGNDDIPEMKNGDDQILERIMKVVNTYIDNPKLNVELLSQEVGISRAHLHRKMKDLIGMTPSDFIRTLRLRRACEVLQKGEAGVSQLAYTLGFTSPSHFSTAFKNYTGYTPTEYKMKSAKGEIPQPEDMGSMPIGKLGGAN